MTNIFLIKLLISFFIGAFWATFSTIIADKYGSKIGGLLAGLPSTVLFSLFFIAWTQSPKIAYQSTTVMPAVSAGSALFILTYLIFAKKGFWFALTLAIFAWLGVSTLILLLKLQNFYLAVIIYLFVLLFCFFIIEKLLKLPSQKGKKIKYTPGSLIFRAVFSGLIISGAGLIAKIGGPTVGGIFSTFPAMFLSTLVITYFSIGTLFSAATMKSSLISGSSVVVYIIFVRFSYLHYNLIIGTIIPTLISFTYGYLLYRFVISKIK